VRHAQNLRLARMPLASLRRTGGLASRHWRRPKLKQSYDAQLARLRSCNRSSPSRAKRTRCIRLLGTSVSRKSWLSGPSKNNTRGSDSPSRLLGNPRRGFQRWKASLGHGMKKKPAPDRRRIDFSLSPLRGMPGVAPIDTNAFSRRAGEIIAKAIALPDEKPKRRSK
jgi:hypothetical protein